MVSAFLRRVIARRELEQELAVLDTPAPELFERCRCCGCVLRDGAVFTVCSRCGGGKRQSQLQRSDVARFEVSHGN